MKVLRHYQVSGVDGVSKEFRDGKKNVILCIATAGGKTACAMEMNRRALVNGKKCLFLSDRNLLIKQFAAEADDWGIQYGKITSTGFSNRHAPFQIASKDTFASYYLRRKIAELPHFDFVSVDEVHRAGAVTWKKVLAAYPKAFKVGLTATPVRPDGHDLAPEWQALVCPVQPSQLLAEGFLVPAECYAPTFPDLTGVRRDGDGDYNKKDLERVMNRNNMVGDAFTWWQRLGQDRQTIVYGVGINHCIALRDEYLKAGVKAVHVNGTSTEEELEDAFGAFKDGKIKVLFSADLITEGADLPICSCIQIIRPSKSLRLVLQMYGRGLRIHPESQKADCRFIDHSGVILLHGMPNQDIPWTLDPNSGKIEAKREKARQEGALPTPIVCPKCFTMYQNLPACPACGHKAERRGRAIKNKPGTLVKVDKSVDGKPKLGVDYNRIWMQCLAIASNRRGGNFSMAAAIFRQRTNCVPWQQDLNLRMFPPEDEFGKRNWSMPIADAYPGFVRKKKEGMVV